MVNSPALAAALVLKGMSLTLQGVGVVPSKVGGSKPDNLIMETEITIFFGNTSFHIVSSVYICVYHLFEILVLVRKFAFRVDFH